MARATGTRSAALVIPMGSSVRVALRSAVLERLLESHVHVAILTPAHADPAFRAEFDRPGVEIHPMQLCGHPSLKAELRQLLRLHRPEARRRLVSTLNHYGYRLGGASGSHRQKEAKLREELPGNYVARQVARIAYRFPGVCDAMLRAEVRLHRHADHDALFDRLRPAVVFTANMFAKGGDEPLKSACRLGIPVVSMVHSWDNVTTADRQLTFMSDRFVVWNEILRDQLVRYHNVAPERVVVTGAPQFDYHVHARAAMPARDAFLTRLGLDPARKLVLYAGCAPLLFPEEPDVVEALARMQSAGRLGDVEILVRLHFKDDMARWRVVADRHPGLRFETAGRSRPSFFDKWDPTEEDIAHFAGLANHCDVCVNMASTATIDAAVFDTPVVNIAYDAGHAKPYLQSVRRYYDYVHYADIVASGGARIVRSHDELGRAVVDYLADPARDRAGREQIVRAHCHTLDGRAADRIADLLLGYMPGGRHRGTGGRHRGTEAQRHKAGSP